MGSASQGLQEPSSATSNTMMIMVMLLLLLSRFSRVRLPLASYFIDSSPPGSAVPGILQARTLEWVAISFCFA